MLPCIRLGQANRSKRLGAHIGSANKSLIALWIDVLQFESVWSAANWARNAYRSDKETISKFIDFGASGQKSKWQRTRPVGLRSGEQGMENTGERCDAKTMLGSVRRGEGSYRSHGLLFPVAPSPPKRTTHTQCLLWLSTDSRKAKETEEGGEGERSNTWRRSSKIQTRHLCNGYEGERQRIHECLCVCFSHFH